MRSVIDYFRGNVRVEAGCRYCERFINICAGNGIEFRDPERTKDGGIRVTIYLKDYKRLKAISARGEFTLSTVETQGVPFFWRKIRKRYVLLAGMALCIAAVWFMSFFIWEIDVQGNVTVPTSRILAELDELGVGVGTCWLTIDHDYVTNKALLDLTDLCWITINTYGSRAEVLVREETPAPDIIDEDTPTVVYAVKAGIITKMNIWNGAQVKNVGQVVMPGDTVVTGAMDSIGSGVRFVYANASVYARTRYEISEELPLYTYDKEYTGDKKSKTALIIGGRRINLYYNSGIPWDSYDKIITENYLSLFGNSMLPFSIVKETYSRYDPVRRSVSESDARSVLTARLTERLAEETGGGEVLSQDIAFSVENGVMTATLTAECEEQIAAVRRMTQSEMTAAEETTDRDPDKGEN